MPTDLYDLIIKRRTVRKFRQEKIQADILEKVVDAGRLAPSSSNLQPWEFIIADSMDLCGNIFSCIKWAGHLGSWVPEESERPTAYIIILVNRDIRKERYEHDTGLAAGNICLSAFGYGVGSCIIRSINREKLQSILKIPEKYIIDLVVALGYPAESPILEDGKKDRENGFVKYWRDESRVFHVPKRPRESIIHRNGF